VQRKCIRLFEMNDVARRETLHVGLPSFLQICRK
jgi:hypothetical protein